MDDVDNPHPATASPARQPRARASAPRVPIRAIGARYRPQIVQHLVGLGEHDRYLRFGHVATDEQLHAYVAGIDFERDQVFGIFNRKLELIAMAHLAHPLDYAQVNSAEFGVSVSPHARGRGYGSLLFERAAVHAVNQGIGTLYIYALSENVAMLRIAQRAGAVIERAGSESQARVRLPAASFRSVIDQLVAEQVGHVDYWLKSEAAVLRGAVDPLQQARRRSGGRDGGSHPR